MNAKAERIENLIQVINRNLLLIYNGQIDGIIPLDNRPTARVDTSMFKGDKFGYEMVNFVRSYAKNQRLTIAAIWERNFVKGLETLITECAVVKDEIERECFVSRVYVWFVEKLVERRDLPDSNRIKSKEISDLKESVKGFGGKHTLKALDNYASSRQSENDAEGESNNKLSPGRRQPLAAAEEDNFEEWEVHYPSEGGSPKQRKGIDILQQQYYPDILTDRDLQAAAAAGNYKPETEAEIAMNELWIARRRQEAFEWKAKQNVDLIMDRRSLHKSRMESEVLRRQETSSYLAMKQKNTAGGLTESEPYHEQTRYAPPMRRPLSGRKHFANIILDAEKNEDIQKTKEIVEIQPKTTLHVIKDGVMSEASVATVQRKIIEKTSLPKKEIASVPVPVPMRYKIDPPEGYAPSSTARKNSKTSTEGFPNSISSTQLHPVGTGAGTGGGVAGVGPRLISSAPPIPSASASTSVAPSVAASASATAMPPRHPKIFSRKVSIPKLFQEMAQHDSELQVHLDYSLSRRMPMTEEQQKWLTMREHERQMKYKHYLTQLAEGEGGGTGDTSGDKKNGTTGSGKGKGKGKKNGKSANGNGMPAIASASASAPTLSAVGAVAELEDPEEIMEKRFPIFDREEYPDAQGALRCQQLEECNRVYEALSKKFPGVDMNVIERALVTPQDRNMEVCLENLRTPLEGLMVNPLPQEYWRTSHEKIKKKKVKKTKSKKGK